MAKDFPIINKIYLTICHQFFGGWDNLHASKYNEKVEKLLKNDKIKPKQKVNDRNLNKEDFFGRL